MLILKITGENDRVAFFHKFNNDPPMQPSKEIIQFPPLEDFFYLYQEYREIDPDMVPRIIKYYLDNTVEFFKDITITIKHD